MYGLIIFIFFSAIYLWAIHKMLAQTPYGYGVRLPWGRHFSLGWKLPFSNPPSDATEMPKLSPLTICYLQGQGLSPRLLIVAMLTLASKGYLILRRNAHDGTFSVLRTDHEDQPPLNATERQALDCLFPDETPELAINSHATSFLQNLNQQLNQSLSEKFGTRRRQIPWKFLAVGLGLSLAAQIGIAITGRFGMQTIMLPVWLFLCPIVAWLFFASLYTCLRAFYHHPFQNNAERTLVSGIGLFFTLIAWVLSLAMALWSYGVLSFGALIGVQLLTFIGLLLCHQPPKEALNGHRAIAGLMRGLGQGMPRTDNETQEIDPNHLLLAVATGTELDFLCPHRHDKKPLASIVTETDRLIEDQGQGTVDDDQERASNAKKLDKRLLALFQRIQDKVPVYPHHTRLILPYWLDLTQDGTIQPDSLANILGELLVMEHMMTLATLPRRR